MNDVMPDTRKARSAPPREAAHLDEEALAALAWAIAHPMRVRILRLLMQKDACVCGELVELLPVAQSTVSQHLKIMKDAGLIQGEVDGPRVCYCVDPKGLRKLKSLMAGL
jgi:ArsR family transcriptional regulator